MVELQFGMLAMWKVFIYNGARYMKNKPNTAVNLDTNTEKAFEYNVKVKKG